MANAAGKNIHQIVGGDPAEISDAIKDKAKIIANCTKIPYNKVLMILCEQKQKNDLKSLKAGLLKQIS